MKDCFGLSSLSLKFNAKFVGPLEDSGKAATDDLSNLPVYSLLYLLGDLLKVGLCELSMLQLLSELPEFDPFGIQLGGQELPDLD
jgi:hypothetical protein